jgi:hypothetical protein
MRQRRSRDQADIDSLAIAFLFAQGRTQEEIGRTLHLSQTTVSRGLRESQPYIQTKREFLTEGLAPDIVRRVKERASPRTLTRRLRELARSHGQDGPIVDVISLPAQRESDGDEQRPQRKTRKAPSPSDESTRIAEQAFARGAAVIVRRLLMDARAEINVGVAWGYTIRDVTRALRTMQPHHGWGLREPVNFVPLSGDPLVDSSEYAGTTTSSRLASDLSDIVNGDGSRSSWLGLVPAYIPRAFDTEESKVIEELISMVPDYQRIFSSLNPVADDLHMILTASGPAERPMTFGHNPLLGLSSTETRRLTAHIYGDIGGVLIPRVASGTGKSKRRVAVDPLVEDVTVRWQGLRMKHLEACARAAFRGPSPSKPGVTLLGFGAQRVDIVLAAVRGGLVNRLIIGSDLEEALIAALPDSA